MSAQCTALRGELRHLGSPSLLGDPARNAPRWAETVIELGDWPAAADALDLGARAADELFRRLPPGDRPRAIAEFRHLALDAASALARAGRLDESLVMLERARAADRQVLAGRTRHPGLHPRNDQGAALYRTPTMFLILRQLTWPAPHVFA
jgi:hypothetical protein